MNAKGRTRWDALIHRARAEVTKRQTHLAIARGRAQGLSQNVERIAGMIHSYQATLADARFKGVRMHDDMNLRRFIEQLRALRRRADVEKANADQDCQRSVAALERAETELLKLQKLAESDLRAAAALRDQREQRQFDETALAVYRQRQG